MIRYSSSPAWGNLEHLPHDLKTSIKVIAGNIEDPEFAIQALRGQDIVFHLAALIAVPYSYLAQRNYVRTNIKGTLNVVEAARRLGVSRVVHTSTSEVYGTAITDRIDESHPLQGQSPFSAPKIGADKIAESYFCSFSTPVVTVRPFNTFGPRQSARAIIPAIISQAATREVIELGALDTLRDMTFVGDTISGFLAAGQRPGSKAKPSTSGPARHFSSATSPIESYP
ncbi:GDP-mannose 4,6 dehydratase [Bradyrhizobium sacchari]|uniref:GDP-mannose 4,6 dehydratase n=2 Tax=Bradyrhizobium sacchari TaxID=1399419 RepID=A0A560KJK0_9BRAD|nr:GDP-mannose 4,6 dehydratase [Bradyrhizobium sacchari]TWB80830.1 GDP-mannose 4,6 dehydratase [Bradyrhizobium sacchari]